MQQTGENSRKPTKIKRKFIIIILVLFAAASAWLSKDLVSKSFKNLNYKLPSSPTQSAEGTNIQELVPKDLAGNSHNSNHSVEIITHNQGQKKNSTAKQRTTVQDQQILSAEGNSCAQSNDENLVYINNYRDYLSNINSLISNFLRDKVYSNQIAYVRMLNLPPSINAVLELLEEYNINYLVSQEQKYVEVFPQDQKILGKFIKVKRLNDSVKNKKLLRANIINNLEAFQDYIYSEELQKIFMGQRD